VLCIAARQVYPTRCTMCASISMRKQAKRGKAHLFRIASNRARSSFSSPLLLKGSQLVTAPCLHSKPVWLSAGMEADARQLRMHNPSKARPAHASRAAEARGALGCVQVEHALGVGVAVSTEFLCATLHPDQVRLRVCGCEKLCRQQLRG